MHAGNHKLREPDVTASFALLKHQPDPHHQTVSPASHQVTNHTTTHTVFKSPASRVKRGESHGQAAQASGQKEVLRQIHLRLRSHFPKHPERIPRTPTTLPRKGLERRRATRERRAHNHAHAETRVYGIKAPRVGALTFLVEEKRHFPLDKTSSKKGEQTAVFTPKRLVNLNIYPKKRFVFNVFSWRIKTLEAAERCT